MPSPLVIPDTTGRLFRFDVGADTGDPNVPFAITEVTGTAVPQGLPGFTSSYTVKDALVWAQKLAKGVPLTSIDLTICNMVSFDMYQAYNWRDVLRVFTPGTYPLSDGVQDYPVIASDIMRVLKFWIVRNDVTPKQYRDINVSKDLAIDLMPSAPSSVRSASYQPGSNCIRLEKAVRVPTGSTWEVGGMYQPHPTKFSDVSDNLWFADEHLDVFANGIAYHALRMANDKDAGAAVKIGDGRVQYSGQLALYKDLLQKMQEAEDFGNIDGYYPDESLGAVDGRRYWTNGMFPYLS